MIDVLAYELKARPGRAADEESAASGTVPVQQPDRLGVRLRRLSEDAAGRTRHGRLRRATGRAGGAAGEVRGGREATDPHRHRPQLLHRGRRCRAAQAHGHPRSRHGRRCRAARTPDRQGRAADLRTEPGPGARDHVRPDRGRGARHLTGRHRRRARRHRPDAVRPRHVRVAFHAGVRRGDRGRRPEGTRPGQDRGIGDARSIGRRPRVGEGPLVRGRRPGKGQDDPGDRAGLPRVARAARGRRGPSGRDDRLQPTQPDVPVRRVHLRRPTSTPAPVR